MSFSLSQEDSFENVLGQLNSNEFFHICLRDRFLKIVWPDLESLVDKHFFFLAAISCLYALVSSE